MERVSSDTRRKFRACVEWCEPRPFTDNQSISVASGSMMAELLPGKSLEEVRRLLDAFKQLMRGEPLPDDLDLGDLEALEGVQRFPVRIKCALLAWTTLEETLKNE